MPPVVAEKDDLYRQLDGMSEHDIQARLKAGLYHPEAKRKLVELYLDEKALARSKAATAEQTGIARSAKNAAWIAAFAALVAAIAAILTFAFGRAP